MKKYNFDEYVNRREFNSSKWSVDEDTISLTVADTDFKVLPEIAKEVEKINQYGRFGYTEIDDSYFEAYVKWYGSRYNAKFSVSDCVFSTGVISSMDTILKRIIKKGDPIMMFTPIYNVFFNCIKNAGAYLLDCPFIYKDHKYSIDWDLFEKNIKKTKVFILCNPHNPTGIRFKEEELQRINELCLENNVYLFADEIHSDIDYNKTKYVSTLAVLENDKLLTFLSPGKTFNLAGLHSSIVVIKNEILRAIIQDALYHDNVGEANIFGINPVKAAFNYGEEYVIEMNDYLDRNREYVRTFLRENTPHLHLIDNEMTYLLWIDVSDYHMSATNFCDILQHKYKLAVNAGLKYGDDRFIRVNIATQFETIKEAMNRLRSYVVSLEK